MMFAVVRRPDGGSPCGVATPYKFPEASLRNYWKVTVSEVVAPTTRISTPGGKSVAVNSAIWLTTGAVLVGVGLSPMYIDKVSPSLV